MGFHLDTLLNLANLTVESCTQQEQQIFLKLQILTEMSDCPRCHHPNDKLHQNCPVLIRDLPVFDQPVHLHVPRRQFYCTSCQCYFTGRLHFVDWEAIHSTL